MYIYLLDIINFLYDKYDIYISEIQYNGIYDKHYQNKVLSK